MKALVGANLIDGTGGPIVNDATLLIDGERIISVGPRAAVEMRAAKPEVTDDAMAILLGHNWPGNIRELQNVVERMVLMCDDARITPAHLPPDIAGAAGVSQQTEGDSSLWGYEKAMIIKALRESRWNQSKAARELGISRDNLRYRVKKYNIAKPT